MAGVHNQLSRGDWSAAVKNVLGATKGDTGVERFGETMQPVLDIWSRPEFALLRKEFLWTKRVLVPGIAAEFAGVYIGLPATSKHVCVFESVSVWAPGGAVKFFTNPMDRATVAATYTLSTGVFCRDLRASPDIVTSALRTPLEMFFGSDAVAVAANPWDVIIVPSANDGREFLGTPYIIRPGWGILLECGTVNTAFEAVMKGYIRSAMPGELV